MLEKALRIGCFLAMAIFTFSACGGGEEAKADFYKKGIFPDLLKPPKAYKMPKDAKGDPRRGLVIFNKVKKKHKVKNVKATLTKRGKKLLGSYNGKAPAGNCAACHCTKDVKGCGNVGPRLNGVARRWKALGGNNSIYQRIADVRKINPGSLMPPTIPTGILTLADIVDVMAYLRTLK